MRRLLLTLLVLLSLLLLSGCGVYDSNSKSTQRIADQIEKGYIVLEQPTNPNARFMIYAVTDGLDEWEFWNYDIKEIRLYSTGLLELHFIDGFIKVGDTENHITNTWTIAFNWWQAYGWEDNNG